MWRGCTCPQQWPCPVPPQHHSTRRPEPSRPCTETLLLLLGVRPWKSNGSSRSEGAWHTLMDDHQTWAFHHSPMSATQFWGGWGKGILKSQHLPSSNTTHGDGTDQGHPSFVFMWAGARNPDWAREILVVSFGCFQMWATAGGARAKAERASRDWS